jgi:hypothetical protein
LVYRDSSVSVVTKLRVTRPGFDFRKGQVIFSFRHRVQTGSVAYPAFYPVGIWDSLSPGVMRPGREADHSPPSHVGVKNPSSYTYTPPRVFIAWYLIRRKARIHGVVLS